MFRVGQRVVCIDPTWGSSGSLQSAWCPNLPIKDRIYTIRDVVTFNGYPNGFLRLYEVVNPVKGRDEPYFEVTKYRPIVERKTDISVFRKLLQPKTEEVT